MIRFFKYLKDRFSKERLIYRTEKIIQFHESVEDKNLTDYVFDMLCLSTEEKVTIEITINPPKPCQYNQPEFKVNGQERAIPYTGSIINALRRAYEAYKINNK